MLIIHIGLRKTASTFLQTQVFPKILKNCYVPLTVDGTEAARLLESGDQKKIETLVEKILVAKEYDGKSDTILISSEGFTLNTSDGLSHPISVRLTKKNSKDFEIKKSKILNSLSILKKNFHEKTGEQTKVLIGIRPQPEILISDYAQESYSFFNPGNVQFSKIVSRLLGSNDEYLEYDKWFEELSGVVGKENLLMFDSDNLSRDTIMSIIKFADGVTLDDFSGAKVNTKRINTNRWKLRNLKLLTNKLKQSIPFDRRGWLFKLPFYLTLTIDYIITTVTARDKEIILTDEDIEKISCFFAESNRKLLTLANENSNQILINKDRWLK